MLTNCLAACTHLSSQLFEPQVQKIAIFTYRSPHFSFPLETPLRLSCNMLHGWKDNSMLAKPFAVCTIYLQYFPSYTMLKSMHKSKNRYFHHIFVFPGDAHGAITLNVVWMEREFDAYKLSRCMCPSNYYRFWDTARYLWKNRHFIKPRLHSTPPFTEVPVGISAPPCVRKKTYNGVATRRWKNFEDMFIRFDMIHERDRQTDRRTDTAWQQRPRLHRIVR